MRGVLKAVLDYLPRGHTIGDADWQRRHRLLLWVLALHVPGLAAFGIVLRHPPQVVLLALVVPAAGVALGAAFRRRRSLAATLVTAGLVYSSAALVGLTGGSIEAHFHFFIIIGFIALYQDWVPFLFNVLFTVLSHGIGSVWQESLIFSHPAGQNNPWLWSLIHGVAVLLACVGMTLFWRITEDQQQQKEALARQVTDLEIGRRQFTSDLLLNLARRNQSMLHRQLDIISHLEESERDPDTLAELFKLDHLATRVRRNAENLLVLSGERPARVWSDPVPLRDVIRAAIGETEDFARVSYAIDKQLSVAGQIVADLTHLLAELVENALRYSPPDAPVTLRARPDRTLVGGQLVTIEDWGVGMPPEAMAAANTLLHNPPEVDLAVSQRLGFHVAGRLAVRHGIVVTLSPTPGTGVTALVSLPPTVFESPRGSVPPVPRQRDAELPMGAPLVSPSSQVVAAGSALASLYPAVADRRRPIGDETQWAGWWEAAVAPDPQWPRPVMTVVADVSSAPPTGRRGTEPATATPVEVAPTVPEIDPVSGLRRRVPQANLAPQLRGPATDDSDATAGASTTPESASALSRYQASRLAARADADATTRDSSR